MCDLPKNRKSVCIAVELAVHTYYIDSTNHSDQNPKLQDKAFSKLTMNKQSMSMSVSCDLTLTMERSTISRKVLS